MEYRFVIQKAQRNFFHLKFCMIYDFSYISNMILRFTFIDIDEF